MDRIIFLLLLLTGCFQDYNSNSDDREKYGSKSQPEQEQHFSAAFKVIQNNCITCHFGRHNHWAANTSDQAWVNTGLVIPGDPFNSRLVTKLQNVGGNMPFQNPPLSEDDFNKLVDWINLMEELANL